MSVNYPGRSSIEGHKRHTGLASSTAFFLLLWPSCLLDLIEEQLYVSGLQIIAYYNQRCSIAFRAARCHLCELIGSGHSRNEPSRPTNGLSSLMTSFHLGRPF
jgi:hypothetical protein